MVKNMIAKHNSKFVLLSIVCAFVLVPSLAQAGGLSGGLSTAKSNLDTIKTWLMTAAGVAAVIYLLFKAVQAWQGRCEWGEFGMAVFYVALAGGAVTIANWAFTLFA